MQEVVKSWFCIFCSQQRCAQLLCVLAECMYDMLFDLEFEATTSASLTSVSLGSNLLHLYPHNCILSLAVTPATQCPATLPYQPGRHVLVSPVLTTYMFA